MQRSHVQAPFEIGREYLPIDGDHHQNHGSTGAYGSRSVHIGTERCTSTRLPSPVDHLSILSLGLEAILSRAIGKVPAENTQSPWRIPAAQDGAEDEVHRWLANSTESTIECIHRSASDCW